MTGYLSNEKYIGCLVAQKSYTDNFLNGKQVENNGEIVQYRFEDNHNAIINRKVFEMVQMKRRGVSLNPQDAGTLVIV